MFSVCIENDPLSFFKDTLCLLSSTPSGRAENPLLIVISDFYFDGGLFSLTVLVDICNNSE